MVDLPKEPRRARRKSFFALISLRALRVLRGEWVKPMKNYTKNPMFVARAAEGERYLITLTDNLEDLKKLFKLNSIGWFIWKKLDRSGDLGELSRLIVLEFDVAEKTASRDARRFIQDLVSVGALLPGETKNAQK